MKRRNLLGAAGAAATALSLGLASFPAQAAWPERPIQLIVPWGAGGGTDAVARFMANGIERELGQPVNVVNRTGGSGVVGHQAIAMAKPDGYTIGLATVEIAMMRHVGLTQLSYKELTPVALVNYDPNAVFVRTDSPITSAQQLLDAAKADPGKLKSAGTGQGGIWHLGLAGMLVESKLPGDAITWVPSQGAAPGLQDLVAGGLDMVSCSLPEARSLIDAGRVRPLVLMHTQPDNLFPKVPLLKDVTGSDWTNGAWRGIVGPKGLPAEIVDKLAAAVKKVYDSKEYADFLASRGFGATWADPAAFADFMAKEDASKGAVMKAVGLAK
jgi:tripartite-type tricarboxylate transporter receptor subunit TctC